MSETGGLTLSERLHRIEQQLDAISTALRGVAGQQQLAEHEARIRALEKVADRYVPDAAEMSQRRQEWERMRAALHGFEAVTRYKRWILGTVVAVGIEGLGLVVAIAVAVHGG